MQVAKLSSMGYMLFWDSDEADRPMVTAAFNAVGAEDCIPTYDAYACSVSVAGDLSQILGLKDSNLGPIHISNLSKEVWGCNVARKIKGKTENQYPHLFSLGLLSDPKEHCVPVGIVKSSITAIDLNKAAIEETATELYAAARTRIPAKDVSRSMVNWIYANKGIMLKDSGSLYFLDEATRPTLEKLCTSLEKGSNDELRDRRKVRVVHLEFGQRAAAREAFLGLARPVGGGTGADRLQAAHVGPGAETPACTGQDDRPHLRVGASRKHGVLEV